MAFLEVIIFTSRGSSHHFITEQDAEEKGKINWEQKKKNPWKKFQIYSELKLNSSLSLQSCLHLSESVFILSSLDYLAIFSMIWEEIRQCLWQIVLLSFFKYSLRLEFKWGIHSENSTEVKKELIVSLKLAFDNEIDWLDED